MSGMHRAQCIHIARRGQAFTLLILVLEAMREPDCWDRHGGTLLPRLFLFPEVLAVDEIAYMTAGECGQHIHCVYTQNINIYIQHLFINN